MRPTRNAVITTGMQSTVQDRRGPVTDMKGALSGRERVFFTVTRDFRGNHPDTARDLPETSNEMTTRSITLVVE